MKEKKIKLPDTTEAEEWITPDKFRYQGKIYKVLLSGKVIPIKEANNG